MNGRTWRSIVEAGILSTLVIACDVPRPTAPARATPNGEVATSSSDADVVRQLAAARQSRALAAHTVCAPCSFAPRSGARVRQDPERHPRHLLHDLPSPRVRNGRREEPVGRTRGNRAGARPLACGWRVHSSKCAGALQHERDAAPLLGRSCRGRRARRIPHAGWRAAHAGDDACVRVRRDLGAPVVPGDQPR